jgi:hypothetical protein
MRFPRRNRDNWPITKESKKGRWASFENSESLTVGARPRKNALSCALAYKLRMFFQRAAFGLHFRPFLAWLRPAGAWPFAPPIRRP